MAYFEEHTTGLISLLEEKKAMNNGAMLALFIDPLIGSELVLPGGEQINQLHITLFSFGEMENLTEGLFCAGCSLRKFRIALEHFARRFFSLDGQVAGVGSFIANHEERPFLALVDIPDLPSFYFQLRTLLEEMNIPYQKNHGYTPHITLKYLKMGEYFPMQSISAFPLIFTGFTLAMGTRRFFFPFK